MACWSIAEARPKDPDIDAVIKGGLIFTGADAAPFIGDVAIRGDTIIYVGPAKNITARRSIDARGMIVTPGLIDAHTHPDTYIRSKDARERVNAPWLTQGVSTLMIGVDGFGTPDVKADIDGLTVSKIGTNVVPFVGFGAVRTRILGEAARVATSVELDKMRTLVAKGMCEGAAGLSAGLFYAPQSFAKTDEVIALAKEAAVRGGLYDTHQRDESDYTIGVLESVKEVIRIGREAGLPVHFAHLKALGVDVQGQAPAIIALINAARAQGLEVTADQYPWLASGSNLEAALVPRWAVDGGYDAMLARLDDPAKRESIKSAMRENLRRRGGAESLLLTTSDRPWTGKTLGAMSKLWNLEPVDAAIRILRDNRTITGAWKTGSFNRGQGGRTASFNMIEPDVEAIMQQPWVVSSSDGSDGHPRQYATFPEKYAVYVKQKRVIDLANFVRHSTGLTADIYKLDRRGYLRPGYFADVLVFNPNTYAPKADYVHPRRLSVGVQALFVNGVLAVQNSLPTGAAAGRGLLHSPPANTCH